MHGFDDHTWFWIKSFTRSMGAAAVLETAAATPPTTIRHQHVFFQFWAYLG